MQVIYCDGASSQFQGRYGKVAVISEEHGSHVLDVLSNDATNNACEYLSMREALIIANDGDEIRSDSQLVVGQLTKGWAVNSENLKALHAECAKILSTKHVTIRWTRREDNLAGLLLERLKGKSMFDDINYNHVKTMTEDADDIEFAKKPFDIEKAFKEEYVREHYSELAGAEAEVSDDKRPWRDCVAGATDA